MLGENLGSLLYGDVSLMRYKSGDCGVIAWHPDDSVASLHFDKQYSARK